MSVRCVSPYNLSDVFKQFLVGKTIPSHISSLPEDFLNTPFGQSLRPMIYGAFTPTPPRPFTPSQLQPPSIPAANSHQNIHFPTTPAEFNSLISSSKMAIAFFTSETCGPCKMIEPLFQSLSTTHTNIRFIQVDTHRAYTIAQQHQITATPTFKAFLNGNIYTEWKGADRAALEFNISGLIEASRPPLPPYLRTQYSQAPILFSRAPPLDKVISKIPTTVIPKPLLDSISNFMSGQKGADVLVPSLSDWAQCQRQMDYAMENAWMVVDLLRAGMADRRISGWFAIDGLATLSDIIHKVLARDESEWQLRVVTVQLVSALPPFLFRVCSDGYRLPMYFQRHCLRSQVSVRFSLN
jgi:desumoylating isopeptidase 1